MESRNTGFGAVLTRANNECGKYKQYEQGRIIHHLKVSTIRHSSKNLVYQSIDSTPTLNILTISENQQYVNHEKPQYVKVSAIRQPLKC